MDSILFFIFLFFVIIVWILFMCNYAKKNNLQKKVVFWMFAAYVLLKGVFYLVAAGGVFFVVSAQTNNFLFGLFCALSLLIVLPTIKIFSLLSESLEEVKRAKDMLFSEIAVDYFHISENSIALSVKDSKIGLAIKDSKGRIHIKTFFIERVRDVRAVKEGYTKMKMYGGSTPLGVEVDNFKSHLNALKKTGLFLYLDDIEFPVVCIPMPFDTAQKWLVLMERFLSGNLEARSTPFTLNI